jgi:hypothetical protein
MNTIFNVLSLIITFGLRLIFKTPLPSIFLSDYKIPFPLFLSVSPNFFKSIFQFKNVPLPNVPRFTKILEVHRHGI